MIDEVGEEIVAVMPLFVAITPSMDLRFPGEGGGNCGDGGGPTDPREAFEANKEMTSPAPN